VLNCSTVPQQKHLELQIDGAREAVSPDLSLPPGGTLKYEFRFTLDREGVHRGEVRLVEEDGLALDNRLYFAVSVDQQIPLAIVKAHRGEVPQADDAFYLERAFAPGGSVGGAFRTTTLTPDSLITDGLSSQAVVFCVDLPALAPPAAEKLLAYARRREAACLRPRRRPRRVGLRPERSARRLQRHERAGPGPVAAGPARGVAATPSRGRRELAPGLP